MKNDGPKLTLLQGGWNTILAAIKEGDAIAQRKRKPQRHGAEIIRFPEDRIRRSGA